MSSTAKVSLSTRLYLAVWRWHFWMGLIAAPVIIIASITGAIYVFKSEIERVMYDDIMFTPEPHDTQVGFDAFATAIREADPAAALLFVNVDSDPHRAWEGISEVHQDDGTEVVTRYYFDPTTQQLTGSLNNETSFFRVVLAIHRRLFAGTPGRLAVETATCWGIVSVLTGLWLWWPRKKEKLWGVWLPRIRGGFRTVIRDWHTVPSVYIALFVLIIMITGLLFTRIWGTAVRAGVFVGGGFPEFFTDPPESAIPDPLDGATSIRIDDAVGIAFAHFDFSKDGYSLGIPAEPSETYQILVDTHVPLADRAAVYLDQYTGETLVFDRHDDIPLATHFLLTFYPLHVGSIFGMPTKILAALSCLLLVAMSGTGIWMWWRRRPAGTLGAPRPPPAGPTPKWIITVTIMLAVLLPTVGITLLLIFLGTWIGRRLKRSASPSIT